MHCHHAIPAIWKRRYTATLFLWLLSMPLHTLLAQNPTNKPVDMTPPFIFDTANLAQNASDLSAIYTSMAQYYEASNHKKVCHLRTMRFCLIFGYES